MDSNKFKEYWQSRNEKTFLAGEKDVLNYTTNLKSTYNKSIQAIEKEINAFYGKYANKEGISLEDAQKLLDKSQLKDFKNSIADIAKYAKENKLDKDYQTKLNLLRAKSRVSRLEELKSNIQFEIEKLAKDITTSMGNILSNSYEDGYYKAIYNYEKQIGLSGTFTGLNKKAIDTAINTKYMTENYSHVIWKNKESLLNILDQQLPQGITLGYNPVKLASIVSKKLDTNYNATVRLARTEYNLILNDATAKGYKECGIDRYQLLATLDNRTSEICQEMDGQIFFVKDKQVGVNYPPFHPNCRTTTIPYFEPDDFITDLQRIAKDNNAKTYYVPANTTYNQWKNSLESQTSEQLIYKGLSNAIKKETYENNDYYDFSDVNKKSDFEDIGNTYFNFESNDSLEKYIKLPTNIQQKLEQREGLKETLQEIQNEVNNLKQPSLINFKLYSAKYPNIDYSKDNYLLAGSLSKEIAKLNTYGSNREVITFYVKKNANIISTFNTSNNHFKNQAEIIIPFTKKLKRIDDYTYLLEI